MNRHARAYRLLLCLYPRSFRERFGDEMVTLFAELVGDARRPGTRFGVTRLWTHTMIDLVTSARRERWEDIMRPHHTLGRIVIVAIPVVAIVGLLAAGWATALALIAAGVALAVLQRARLRSTLVGLRGDRWWLTALLGVALFTAGLGSLWLPISSASAWTIGSLLGVAGLGALGLALVSALAAIVRPPATSGAD